MLHPIPFLLSLTHLKTFLFLMTVVVLSEFNLLSLAVAVVVTVCGAVGGTLRGLGVVEAGRGYTRFSLSPGNVYIGIYMIQV